MREIRAIFLGTPEFAINSLKALVDTAWVNILCVITQPDRPANRGKKIISPPIKVFAQENNLEILQTPKISKDTDLINKIKKYQPDILITCAFGQILSQEILDIALTLNVHASLLPKYRGAAPINWAILNGETETGITIMKTVKALDAGPILLAKTCSINENETSDELFKKLSSLGGNTLIKGLALIRDEKTNFQNQDESLVTYASMLKKEMGIIDWKNTSSNIHNQIRGLQPWPSAYTYFQGKSLKIWKSEVRSQKLELGNQTASYSPGQILEINENIIVKTGNESIVIKEVQPENKKPMSAKDWVNGARVKVGDRLI